MLDGIDVSKYQATTPDLTGQSFLFARATYATTRDALYGTHIGNARKAGLVTGAYHFGVNGIYVSIADQVAAFLGAAQDADLYVLDLESDGSRTAMSEANATAFIAAVKGTGRKVGLYHSASGFPNVGQDWNWIAKWGTTPPTLPWTFWQWQGSPLDRDKYPGTIEELRAFAGHPAGGQDVHPATDIPVALCDVAAGTRVIDAATGAVLIVSWAGGSGIGLYSIGGGNAALRLDLGDAVAGHDYRVAYVVPAAVSNVRLKDAPPGDYAKGKADQKVLDIAAVTNA